VGAAAGFFVDEANADGWAAEGIDIAEQMVAWGVSNLNAPLRVDLLQSIRAEKQYAVVTMWDYIEHSLDPAGEIAKATDLLCRGGLLAISTGDVDSLVARLSRSRWHLLTPRHHNFFFGLSTLKRLLQRQGLEVVWSRHPGSRYSFEHLSYKLDRTMQTRLTKAIAAYVASSDVGRLSIPLNLFDIVTVIGQAP
jgi:hypothetical protein